MRRILLNELRKKGAIKRGGDQKRVAFDSAVHTPEHEIETLFALEEALRLLESHNEYLHRVVELRFFIGMTFVEIGKLLERNERTIRRDWTKAQAFLSNALRA